MKFEPWTFAYKLLGKRVQNLLPHFQDLHNQLKKGGVRIAFPAYLSFMLLMSIVSFIVSMIILPFLLTVVLRISFFSLGNFMLSLMLAALSSIMTIIVIYVYPGIKSSNRRIPIEINLPYISSFLTLLSSSNVPPRKIFRSIAKIDTLREVRQEFSNIIRDVEIFGQDLLTSILENVKYAPSKKLREILSGYVATVRTGGNPTEYLRISTENIMKDRMVKLDLMLESLSAMAEIYIMVLVAMPLLFVVMFATLGMLGGAGTMNPALMLYLLTYVGIPIMASILVVVVSTFSVK
ncbi:MAG: type II secretion system F family protein [Candidatus Bathyarchaeota archaeon]|nr:MAG: type II secretion system F family protein [Candidatus Bathyarchaeota archaeon]